MPRQGELLMTSMNSRQERIVQRPPPSTTARRARVQPKVAPGPRAGSSSVRSRQRSGSLSLERTEYSPRADLAPPAWEPKYRRIPSDMVMLDLERTEAGGNAGSVDGPSDGSFVEGIDLSNLPETDPEEYDEREDTGAESEAPEERALLRVRSLCACQEFDKEKVQRLLSQHLGRTCKWKYQQETICVPFSPKMIGKQEERGPRSSGAPQEDPSKSVIFFKYGVVVTWGLTPSEQDLLQSMLVNQVRIRALEPNYVEKDELKVSFNEYSSRASILNHTIMLPKRLEAHVGTRLAIAHALAQSTKFSVFEEQGRGLVRSAAHFPKELAESGHVSLSSIDISKMIGRIFVHRNEVNNMSSVLDLPEYFWEAPDCLQELYKEIGAYYEMEERIGAVNNHLENTQDMLDMLQSRNDAAHGSRLEWIVIWLVALEGFIGFLELLGSLGFLPSWQHGGRVSAIAQLFSMLWSGGSDGSNAQANTTVTVLV